MSRSESVFPDEARSLLMCPPTTYDQARNLTRSAFNVDGGLMLA
jgi:hypothetical protein